MGTDRYDGSMGWPNHCVWLVLATALGEEGCGSDDPVEVPNPLADPDLCGTRIEDNEVVQHGSAIFFVSNDHSGDIRITHSNLTDNVGGSWYPTYDQISAHDDTPIAVTESVIGDDVIP